jgi:protein TonB
MLVGLPALFENRSAMDSTDFDPSQEFSLTVVDEEQELDEQKRKERDGQFVSLPAPPKEQRPEEARFLDQYDSKTDKETARRDPGDSQNTGPTQANQGQANPQASNSQPRPRSQPTHQPDRKREPRPPQPDKNEPSAEEPSAEEQAADPVKNDEPAERAVDLDEADTAERGVVEDSSAKKQASRPDPSQLFPSTDSAQAAMGGGGSIDYLRNVDEGDKTLLNRKKSRYWSFMSRLKGQVVQEWSPGEEYRRRDPRGKVYGVKDRFTNLRITLNGDGSLRTIYVAKGSGLDFYDDEAVRAVRDAAPFPTRLKA